MKRRMTVGKSGGATVYASRVGREDVEGCGRRDGWDDESRTTSK